MQENIRDLDLMRRLFDYNPDTGVVFWRERFDVPKWWNTRYAGKSPCATDSLGYIRAKITVEGFSGYVSLHRICFFLANEYLPEVVDHINGNVQDNRACNLRAADLKTNTWNRCGNKGTITGRKGVHAIRYQKGPKKGCISGYSATIQHEGVRKYLGYFDNPDDAGDAVEVEEIKLRSEWKR